MFSVYLYKYFIIISLIYNKKFIEINITEALNTKIINKQINTIYSNIPYILELNHSDINFYYKNYLLDIHNQIFSFLTPINDYCKENIKISKTIYLFAIYNITFKKNIIYFTEFYLNNEYISDCKKINSRNLLMMLLSFKKIINNNYVDINNNFYYKNYSDDDNIVNPIFTLTIPCIKCINSGTNYKLNNYI